MGKAGDASKVTNNLIKKNSTLNVGDISLKALYTPGHTLDSFCFYLEPYIFTGDTLLINSTGRTDIGNGNAEMMYDLLKVKPNKFRPSIPNLVYQYEIYTNYESEFLNVYNPEVDSDLL